MPTPPPAELGQQRDVHDPDLAVAAVDVEPPGGLAVDLDDVEARAGVVLAVVRVLRVELRARNAVLLRVRPTARARAPPSRVLA